MPDLLFIVAREEPRLHAYLKEHFADVQAVEIIFDRRQGEPAGPRRPPAVERRQKQIDDDIRKRGWAVVNRAQQARAPGNIVRT
jgi:hypothetical protein